MKNAVKFYRLFVLIVPLFLEISCQKEIFSKADFAGNWENSFTLKSSLYAQEENPESSFAEVYTECKIIFSFTASGNFKKHTQNKIQKIEITDNSKCPENFSPENLKNLPQLEQTDCGDFFITKSLLTLENYYQIQNGQITELEAVIPVTLSFEFSQDKKELVLNLPDNQSITLKKQELTKPE